VRLRLLLLSVLAGIVVPAGSALAALPHGSGIGIRLADVPANSVDPRAHSYIVDQVAPGTTIRRRIEIVNSTGSAANIALYPAAAGLRGSRFGFAPGHSRNELTSWTSMSRAVLRVPPGAKTFETVTIDVPKAASAGERYAVIWAEVSAPAPAAGGVTIVNRVGIRMYLSIGPGGAPVSNFAIGTLTADRSAADEPLIVARIRNTGRRTIDIGGTLTLSQGPGGLSTGPIPVRLATAVSPGDSEALTVRLDRRLPRGPWHARLRLKSGFVERSVAATIRFPSPAAPAATWSLGAILFDGALLALALAALAFRHLQRERRARGPFGLSPARARRGS
jgi:hypothetical protein